MERRAALGVLLLAAWWSAMGFAGAGRAAAEPPGSRTPNAPRTDARQQALDGWWERQREREAADRFWNGPREQRRNLTRDQIEQWERQKDRRSRQPSWPF